MKDSSEILVKNLIEWNLLCLLSVRNEKGEAVEPRLFSQKRTRSGSDGILEWESGFREKQDQRSNRRKRSNACVLFGEKRLQHHLVSWPYCGSYPIWAQTFGDMTTLWSLNNFISNKTDPFSIFEDGSVLFSSGVQIGYIGHKIKGAFTKEFQSPSGVQIGYNYRRSVFRNFRCFNHQAVYRLVMVYVPVHRSNVQMFQSPSGVQIGYET